MTIKIILGVVLVLCVILTAYGIWANKAAMRVSQAFILYSTKFASASKATLLYIPLFTIIMALFVLLIVKEYSAFASVAAPTFNPTQIYYEVE